ncbi:hypothetical protein GIB67_030221 [Kingdonia uniflora]|uniref:Uncharacterized protein n=1 Tax=Kingdonia uniflora TaxID=39325 RepID=A0A7J7MNC6_9MAGN|nr:hypothetical protein GIB67_030221 [Kingdonia uniflora]
MLAPGFCYVHVLLSIEFKYFNSTSFQFPATMGAGISTPRGEWSSGLCSCEGDFGTCCITFFLPCVTFGRIAETVDEGQSCCITCWLPCITFGRIAEVLDEGRSSCGAQGCIYGLLMLISCNCLYSCTYRSKLRAKFGLPSSGCCDFCVHCCCESCALCQLHEELKNRGLDPSIGLYISLYYIL